MATVYISEYEVMVQAPFLSDVIQTPLEPAVIEQTVAITANSVQSNAFGPSTRFIRIHTDAICSRRFGKNPTALATSARMADESSEYLAVNPGDKVAIITNT